MTHGMERLLHYVVGNSTMRPAVCMLHAPDMHAAYIATSCITFHGLGTFHTFCAQDCLVGGGCGCAPGVARCREQRASPWRPQQ